MASADERKSNRGNKDHRGGDPQGLRGVTLNGQGATPKGGRMRLDDDSCDVGASGLMKGEASGSEPDEGIREPTRTSLRTFSQNSASYRSLSGALLKPLRLADFSHL
jgi:hypothetical protein